MILLRMFRLTRSLSSLTLNQVVPLPVLYLSTYGESPVNKEAYSS